MAARLFSTALTRIDSFSTNTSHNETNAIRLRVGPRCALPDEEKPSNVRADLIWLAPLAHLARTPIVSAVAENR
jgi:hypothetical protein